VLQAKDDLRLVGVTHSCPILISKMAAGGPATHYVVQEFAAQMRAVCKIALHRPSNLASYLEDHGLFLATACYICCVHCLFTVSFYQEMIMGGWHCSVWIHCAELVLKVCKRIKLIVLD
jgi:hypothetical protein